MSLICEVCDKSFHHKGNLKNHLRIAHEKCDEPFQCKECDTLLSSKETLQNHVSNVHDNIRNHHCNYCPKSFKRAEHLKVHLMQVHEKVKPHKCDTCAKAFSDKGDLTKHIKAVHKKIKIQCNICKKFYGKSGLLGHVRRVHQKEKFKCGKCDKSFTTKRSVELHDLAVHKKEKPCKCDICDMPFDSIGNLKKHYQGKHEKLKVKCDLCGKELSLLSIGQHKKVIHDIENAFSCKICEKDFTNTSNLKVHHAVHHELKKLECQFCSFETKYNQSEMAFRP